MSAAAPFRPKLLGVSTMPVPKWPFQTRLTITRMASGCVAMVRASSSRPLPLEKVTRSPGLSTERNPRGTRVAEAQRIAAQVNLQVERLLDVAHAVHVRVTGVELLLRRLDVLAQALDQRATIVAQPLFEAPAAEAEQARLRLLAGHERVGLRG